VNTCVNTDFTKWLKVALSAALAGSIWSGSAAAQTTAQPPSLESIQAQLADLEQFPLFLPASRGALVAADDLLSPTRPAEPSLAWIRDQIDNRYGSDRLVEQWRAYQVPSGPNYVDVIVNEQIWGLLNYFERYAFISQFGTAAKDYRYNLRVFDSGDVINSRDAITGDQRRSSARLVNLRGGYFCSFDQALLTGSLADSDRSDTAELPCTATLDDSGSRRVRNRAFLKG
jgi:hypothetical protein